MPPPPENIGRKAALTNTFIYYSEFLLLFKHFSSFSADSVQMCAKSFLCVLSDDKFGFQSLKLKLTIKKEKSRGNICDKQVISDNIRQFLSVKNYYSLIFNQPSLL